MYLVNNIGICSIFASMIDYNKWVLFLKSYRLVICLLFDLGFRLFGCLASPLYGGFPLKSQSILRLVLSQFDVTLWACMSGFLHAVHAERDQAARPTSNEAKNHCNQEL